MYHPEPDEEMPGRQIAMESEVVEKSGDKVETKVVQPDFKQLENDADNS